jgi:hypothetical protein
MRSSQARRRQPQNLIRNKLLKLPQIAVADAELLQLGDCMKQIGRARTDMSTSAGDRVPAADNAGDPIFGADSHAILPASIDNS